MKLYRVDWQSMDGSFIGWCTSAKAAVKRVREVKDNDPDSRGFDITKVDVPTTRKALALWLDHRYNANNG